MNGLTPWEIASLKVAHHRRDEGNKGYLDRRDFDGMCEECNLGLNEGQTDLLFKHMDLDRDGRISFEELLNYLTTVTFSKGISETVVGGAHDDGGSGSRESPSTSSSSAATAVIPQISSVSAAVVCGESSAQGYGGGLSAEDTVLFLSNAATLIRLSYASDMSAIFAGGILGLLPLIKSKFFIVAGTLFYDPIRLFRDNIVDYTGSLENNNASKKATVTAYQFLIDRSVPWTTRLRMSFLLCRGIMGVFGWVVFAATLDCMGGVVMFLTYARARQKLLQTKQHSSTSRDGELEGDQGNVFSSRLRELRSFVASKRYLLEATAGLVGGAAGGFVERPLRYVAHHRILSPVRLIEPMFVADAFKGCSWAVYRQSISHAVFFTVFSFAHDTQRSIWYRRLKRERNTWSDACITAISGCCAGGSYRLVSLPMLNIYSGTKGPDRSWRESLCQPRSIEFFRQQPSAGAAFKAAYKGLGYSMLWIMPITGAAFLVYERLLVTL